MKDPLLIAYLTKKLQDIYEYGIQWYKRAVREKLRLRDLVELLPEKCPWILEELMESERHELLDKLPEGRQRNEQYTFGSAEGMTYQEALRKEVTERQIEVAGEFILLVESYGMSRLEKEEIIG